MKMARRKAQRIFFPWEGRLGFRGWARLGHVRAFFFASMVFAFLGFVIMRERQASGVRQTRARLGDVGKALENYRASHEGSCPKSLSELGDYGAFKVVPGDAWGRPLRLICPTDRIGYEYELMSDGPDGQPGGLDRIEL
jgi:general secretion pathway protein G